MSLPYWRAGLVWCAFLPAASRHSSAARTIYQDQFHDLLIDSCPAVQSWNAALPAFYVATGCTARTALRQRITQA